MTAPNFSSLMTLTYWLLTTYKKKNNHEQQNSWIMIELKPISRIDADGDSISKTKHDSAYYCNAKVTSAEAKEILPALFYKKNP
jgi:hypothetical protein